MLERGGFVEVWRLAIALGWSTAQTRVGFTRAGVATRLPGRRDWYVARDWLLVNMSSVVARLDELERAGALRSNRGPCKHPKTGRFIPVPKSNRRIESH